MIIMRKQNENVLSIYFCPHLPSSLLIYSVLLLIRLLLQQMKQNQRKLLDENVKVVKMENESEKIFVDIYCY